MVSGQNYVSMLDNCVCIDKLSNTHTAKLGSVAYFLFCKTMVMLTLFWAFVCRFRKRAVFISLLIAPFFLFSFPPFFGWNNISGWFACCIPTCIVMLQQVRWFSFFLNYDSA